jgi:hypothetical protein
VEMMSYMMNDNEKEEEGGIGSRGGGGFVQMNAMEMLAQEISALSYKVQVQTSIPQLAMGRATIPVSVRVLRVFCVIVITANHIPKPKRGSSAIAPFWNECYHGLQYIDSICSCPIVPMHRFTH